MLEKQFTSIFHLVFCNTNVNWDYIFALKSVVDNYSYDLTFTDF